MTLLACAIAWLLAAAAFNLGWSPWIGVAVAPAVALFLPAWRGHVRLVHLVAAAVGAAVAATVLSAPPSPLPLDSIGRHLDEPATLLVRANGDGDRHPSYVALTATALARDEGGQWRPASGRISAFLPASTVVHDGDELQVSGTLSPPGGANAPSGYRDWLSRRGVVAAVKDPRVRVVASGGSNGPLAALRERIRNGLDPALSGRDASLAFALLFGGRHALPADLNDDLVRSGTAHLAVVSAFNLALLFGAILALGTPLLGRRRAAPLALAAALAYGALAGSSPSVVRGEILVALMTLSLVSGRPHSRTALLALAAAAMTLPDARLLADVSFQLTFAAAVSATLLTAPLRRLTLRAARVDETDAEDAPTLVRIGGSALALSLAVSFACLPILAGAFGAVPTYGVLCNALISPLAPALMALALLVGTIGSLALPVAQVAAVPLWLGLRALESAIHVSARLPGADFGTPASGTALACAWYAALTICALAEARWMRIRSPDLRRRFRRRPAGRRPSLAARSPVVLAAAIALALVAVPTSVLVGRQVATGGRPGHAVVRWRTSSLGSVQEIEGANGSRVLLVDGGAPSMLAAIRASGGLGDRTVDAVVVARSDARYANPELWVEAARGARAGTVLFAPGAPGGAAARHQAELGLLLVSGRASIDLGGGDRLDLLTDGNGAATVGVAIDGRFAILAGTEYARRLLNIWRESGPADVVVLPGIASDRERQAIAELLPSLAILTGRSGPPAPTLVRTVLASETRDLRLSTVRGRLVVSYHDR